VVRALVLFLALISAPAVTARIETGLHPCGIAAVGRAVWVANDGSGTLTRIDPRTNRVTRRVKAGRGACAVAAGAGFVWVANYETGSLLRLDPDTLRVRRVRVGGTPLDVLVAMGRVWVSSWEDGVVAEVDPSRLRVIRRVDVGPYPMGLARRGGSIWVGFGRSATSIVRLDPASGDTTAVAVHIRAPAWFAEGAPGLWITGDDNALVHVDPKSRRVVGTIRFGRTLAHPTAGPNGTIWVPDKEIDRVFLVDPGSGRVVRSFPGGDGAYEVLRAFGSMWITSYAGSDVWRYRAANN
jgi:YVTN family beta-propeller protein